MKFREQLALISGILLALAMLCGTIIVCQYWYSQIDMVKAKSYAADPMILR